MKIFGSRFAVLQVIAALLFSTFAATSASAQFVGVQYGPKAFSWAPAGTNVLAFGMDKMDMTIGLNGAILSAINIKSTSYTLTYGRYFALGGKSAQFSVSVPFVDIGTGVVTTCCGTCPALSANGITDPYLQFSVALIGGESLSPREFVQKEPGFVLSFMAGARVPLGKYNSASPINVASNRFEYRFGLPMSYTWGTPGQQTAVEFTPVVYFFQENDDPFGARLLELDPVIQLEAHVSKDFGKGFWGALNAVHVRGGATSTDGLHANNDLAYSSVGFSLGGRLSRQIGFSVTASRRLSSKSDLDDGNFFRLGLNYTF